jgi:hypothetical protein
VSTRSSVLDLASAEIVELAGLPGVALADVRARVEARVGAAFRTQNTRRQAHRDVHTLTMSGLGGCLRWAAYTMAGIPRSEPWTPEEAREAMLGTIIHEFLLPSMAELVPGALVELPVVLAAAGLRITGTLDWIWVDPDTGDAEVGDLKTVREWKLNGVVRYGAFEENRLQVFGYALAAAQAGYRVRWLWWLYLDRSTGQVYVVVEEFTAEKAYAVVQRLTAIKHSAAGNPDAAPREARGPGFSPVCDRCPWLRRCWGDDARPGQRGPQKQLAATTAGIVAAVRGLFMASGASSNAEQDKDFFKFVLKDVPDGPYGDFVLKRRRSGKTLDQAESKARMEAAGIDVPEREKEKSMHVSAR